MHGAGIEEYVRPTTSPIAGQHCRRFAPIPWILMCAGNGDGGVESCASDPPPLHEVHSQCNTGASLLQEQLQPPPLPVGMMKWVKTGIASEVF
ncbi:hypothetical protein HPB50_009069 [Hyalomma asiaticum]|uniref:Uncharacterized protein n=1 Tax=Hyalomma asiaticum TaxID=266040 RepID=A0ACB7RHF3_HYAAI|nr:hypothetical protein HPB50_009069 [Hyalomma asiaticum]